MLYTALGYAAPEIKAGRLVPLLEDWWTRSAAIFLYYPSRRQVPVPLQAFIEFLRENLQREPTGGKLLRDQEFANLPRSE